MEEEQPIIQQAEIPKVIIKVEEIQIEIPILASQDFDLVKSYIDYAVEKIKKDVISDNDFKQYLIAKKFKRENGGLSYVE